MSKVAKTTFCLIIITMLSKVFGFGRELVLTYIYGTGYISDAYITSMNIPTLLFTTIGSAIGTTFIPLFYDIEKELGNKKSLSFVNNILNIVIIISTIVALLIFIFTDPIVKIFAIDFSGHRLELAIQFTKVMAFGIIFLGISSIMTAWLQIKENFTIPGMIGLPFNIFIVAGIIISSNGNLNMMAIGTLVGFISQFILQLPFAIKKGFKYKLYINFKDEYIYKMLRLVIPVFIGVGVTQINGIVDRSLASTLPEGTITILNSANRLNGFVLGLFITTIASVIYPTLSKLSNDGNKEEFLKSVLSSINSVIILIIPISIGAIVISEPIVRCVFERGAFNESDTSKTAIALACYSIGMVGFGLREILNKVFYALQDTKTPMLNGAIAMGLNVVLNIILIKLWGYAGLALATSISSLICISLLFSSLKKNIDYFGQDKILITTIKSLISAIVMGCITQFSYNSLTNILGLGFIREVVTLFGSIVIGVIVYGTLIIALKVEEVKLIKNMVEKKIRA